MRTSQKVYETLVKGSLAYKVGLAANPNKRVPIQKCFTGVHIGYSILDQVDWNKSDEECAMQIINIRKAYMDACKARLNAKKAEPATAAPATDTAVSAPDNGVTMYRTDDGELWLKVSDLLALLTDAKLRGTMPVPSQTMMPADQLFQY